MRAEERRGQPRGARGRGGRGGGVHPTGPKDCNLHDSPSAVASKGASSRVAMPGVTSPPGDQPRDDLRSDRDGRRPLERGRCGGPDRRRQGKIFWPRRLDRVFENVGSYEQTVRGRTSRGVSSCTPNSHQILPRSLHPLALLSKSSMFEVFGLGLTVRHRQRVQGRFRVELPQCQPQHIARRPACAQRHTCPYRWSPRRGETLSVTVRRSPVR